jgi:hypothetical protein
MCKGVINISSPHSNAWLRQFPEGKAVWGEWKFIFNADSEVYDYLVIFDDLHAPVQLRCRPENTIHLSVEPPIVLRYPERFLRQFSWVVTQDKRIKHPGVIYGQPGLTWFIGRQPGLNEAEKALSFKCLEDLFDMPKTKLISVIASNKAFTPDHAKRLIFAKKLKKYYGDKIDFYGRGFTQMDDKLDALQNYRFNVVLENSSVDDYFSEKLTDCVIAGTYPIYYGCPNLESYFPASSFARIDINDFGKSVEVIDNALAGELDRVNREKLRHARDLAMNKFNLYPMLVELIENIEAGKYGKPTQPLRLDSNLLPHDSEQYKAKIALTLRGRLNNLANNNIIFDILRHVYKIARGSI